MSEKITPQMVKELRERTGVGMSKCKEALVESDADMDKAIEYLRKIGMTSGAKKEGRETKEGIICVGKSPKNIAILEVNAETDFVVKNEKFQAFVHDISQQAAKAKPSSLDEFLSMGSDVDPVMTVDQLRNSLIQRFGENIQIKRLEIIYKDPASSYGIYSHMGGKIVTIVEIAGSTDVEDLAKDIAMHVAAENPDFLRLEDMPEDIKKREEEIARSQIKNKPPEIIDRIVAGKVKAYAEGVCLLMQKFIKDSSKTVEKVVEEHSKKIGKPLKVVRFWRWKVGQ